MTRIIDCMVQDAEIMSFVEEARASFDGTLISITLFGSRASGTGRPDSDFDIALLFKDGSTSWRTRKAASLMAFEYLCKGIDIRCVVLEQSMWHEETQFMRHIRTVGKHLWCTSVG